jgi:hypothetical protein
VNYQRNHKRRFVVQLMSYGKIIILVLLFSILFGKAIAQHSSPDTIRAITVDKINLDGKLTEPVWLTAPSVNNFTQRELDFGKPSTEQTQVAIVYNNLALHVGVWCYQKRETIVAKFMQRDFDFDTEDNFEVIISPFNDKRNGYLFVINPNGARADALVSGQESSNINWNGVWDAKTSVTDEGWFAEIRIPFNSLQFKEKRYIIGQLILKETFVLKTNRFYGKDGAGIMNSKT